MSLAVADNPRAVIGSNQPPATPYDQARDAVESIYGEAKLWLDGAKVDSQDLADGMGNLLSELRKAGNVAEEARKTEKKYWDDGAKEVQSRFKPLLDKIEQATKACKAALAPWLAKLEAEQRAKAEAAREAAEAAQREAEQAIRTAPLDDLAAREEAEAKIAEAKAAEKAARKAENESPQAGGLMGRKIGLKTVFYPALTNGVEAARHYWSTDRAAMEAFLLGLAEKDVRAGKREIPGFHVIEKKEAV